MKETHTYYDDLVFSNTYHHELASRNTCIKKAQKVMVTAPCRESLTPPHPEHINFSLNNILT